MGTLALLERDWNLYDIKFSLHAAQMEIQHLDACRGWDDRQHPEFYLWTGRYLHHGLASHCHDSWHPGDLALDIDGSQLLCGHVLVTPIPKY